MAKYKPQHARLLFIDRKLREKHFPNCTSLAQEWEVSVRTIQRDLDYMRYELDAPVAYAARERGYYYSEEQYRLPAINIRESDLFAIYLAEKLLTQYEGTPVYDNLRSVFSKIEECLPDKATIRPGDDPGLFTVLPPFFTVILPEVLSAVFACLRASTRMEIEYRGPGGDAAWRTVDPYHGVRFEGDWYVVGHCHLRRAIRTFSLARMTAVRQTTAHFVRPPSFDFRKLFGSHFGIHWGQDETEVRIHFTARAAVFIRERQWHPSQRIDEQNDGSLILTLTVNHLLALKRWILSWGDDARVLTPRDLADDLRRTALRMAAMPDNSGA